MDGKGFLGMASILGVGFASVFTDFGIQAHIVASLGLFLMLMATFFVFHIVIPESNYDWGDIYPMLRFVTVATFSCCLAGLIVMAVSGIGLLFSLGLSAVGFLVAISLIAFCGTSLLLFAYVR